MSTAPPTDAGDTASASPPRSPAPTQEEHGPTDTAALPVKDDESGEEDNTGKQVENEKDQDQDQQKENESFDGDNGSEEGEAESESAPPLPEGEVPPPLPDEAPPGKDDGWEPVWDATTQAYYFYNRLTGASQWENPRVPDAPEAGAPGVDTDEPAAPSAKKPSPALGGYNPAIHGDYDPTAPYAQQYEPQSTDAAAQNPSIDPNPAYAATGAFNRFTGRWQAENQNPENHNDANKSYRQMNSFFDVDAAANSHDGRSLRAERSAKKLSRKEVKQFKEKRREKKEEKRRAWLRD
ncbi:hypothetical protein FE257_004477 [Aspergillus nanangensis]|uniref:WW domain-containing protein n=1 Tax=Aspergillus nanangensis TaxID=2582783 RepID=A0AAD4CY41_ASPNN|nr:hypothetical protein FE257_004477 [Aspergillus nanangensis]